jgi:WD40 repeat protein
VRISIEVITLLTFILWCFLLFPLPVCLLWIPATQNISLVLHGHTAPVSTVSSNPSRANSLQILSGSYDGTCKIWDTRSTKQSLYTISNPTQSAKQSISNPNQKLSNQKILAVGWNSDGNLLGSGGEDRKLSIHSVN